MSNLIALKIFAKDNRHAQKAESSEALLSRYNAVSFEKIPRNMIVQFVVLGRSSIIIDNRSFASLILINRLQNGQSIIIGKCDT